MDNSSVLIAKDQPVGLERGSEEGIFRVASKPLEITSWVGFQTTLSLCSETSFSCYSKNSLDSSSVTGQKPSLLFTY